MGPRTRCREAATAAAVAVRCLRAWGCGPGSPRVSSSAGGAGSAGSTVPQMPDMSSSAGMSGMSRFRAGFRPAHDQGTLVGGRAGR